MLATLENPARSLRAFEQIYHRHGLYLRRLLHRRGLSPAQLDEGVLIALQHLAIDWLEKGLPTSWPELRPLLDRAVYRAMRELRPLATLSLNEELIAAGRRPEELQVVLDRLGALRQPQRLLLQLKLAWYYYPELPDAVHWTSDEEGLLRTVHPGQTPAQVTCEFLRRLRSRGRQHWRTVPAELIAWLLGRASAAAVDQAWRSLRLRLQQELNDDLKDSLSLGSEQVSSHSLEKEEIRLAILPVPLSVPSSPHS